MLNHLLTFKISEQQYALSLASVQQVVRIVEVTPLPKSPAAVLGVIDLHGRIIPVLNVRRRFGLAENEPSLNDQFIIADTSTRTVALMVNSVTGVIEKPQEEIARAEDIVPGTEYVEGIAEFEDGILFIHDLNSFLSYTEETQLQDLLAQSEGRK